MNKPLSMTETITFMSRREKLLRWAKLIARHPTQIMMMHDLEYMSSSELYMVSGSIFDVAVKDPVFKVMGLTNSDALSGKRFFELTSKQLHYIGCDCMGQISNEEMARRVEYAANIRD